jgi:hypothetical protein
MANSTVLWKIDFEECENVLLQRHLSRHLMTIKSVELRWTPQLTNHMSR